MLAYRNVLLLMKKNFENELMLKNDVILGE